MATIPNRAASQIGPATTTQLDGVAGMVTSTSSPNPAATFGTPPIPETALVVPALTGATTTVPGKGTYVASGSSADSPAWRAFENVSGSAFH
jgi:hypothetical protein